MEKGFYHPERGYWQTIGEPSADILASYPEGTIEVPLKPGEFYEWDGEEWVYVAVPPPEEPRASMPPLTSRQLRLALVMNGIALSDVESAIAEIEDAQQRAIAEIEWEYATQFERIHPLIDQLGGALGLTPEQIDDMWWEAANL